MTVWHVPGHSPLTPRQRLQCYCSYQYTIRKARPFYQIVQTAETIVREGLPIKCIEATFLGAFLTCKYPEWERMPVGFKTKMSGQKNAYKCASGGVCDT
jgi:Vasohibin